MDSNIKEELDVLDNISETYWKEIDEIEDKTDWEQVTEYQKNEYAKLLLGDLGNDIKDVTSGKIKVKLPLKLKIKRMLENFFKIF